MPDDETIARFVVRARRVEAHSLVQDSDALQAMLTPTYTVVHHTDGSSRITRRLPENEEIFESLAARVRPLILDREPIFHEKVLGALQRLVEASPHADAQQREQLERLTTEWTTATNERQSQIFQAWMTRADGSESTGPVSDAELAAGWLYADLVHADPRSWKKKALAFPIQDRYSAAVSIYSRIASLTVTTLSFIRHLHQAGVLRISDDTWTAEVVVGAAEFTFTATAYLAPPETPLPDITQSFSRPGSDWTQLTIMRQLQLDEANHVQVELASTDGAVIASYDGAVMNRRQEGDVLHWSALVEDCLSFHIQLQTDGESAMPVGITHRPIDDSLRIHLAARQVMRQLLQASTLTFRVRGHVFVQGNLSAPTETELRRFEIDTETLDDLVTIERAANITLGPLTRGLSPAERVRLRQLRLLWQGYVVPWDRELSPAQLPTDTPPDWLRFEPSVLNIAGAEVSWATPTPPGTPKLQQTQTKRALTPSPRPCQAGHGFSPGHRPHAKLPTTTSLKNLNPGISPESTRTPAPSEPRLAAPTKNTIHDRPCRGLRVNRGKAASVSRPGDNGRMTEQAPVPRRDQVPNATDDRPYSVLSNRAIVGAAVVLLLVGAGLAITLLIAFGGGQGTAQLDAIRTAGTIVIGTGGAAALWLAARRQRTSEIALNQKHADQVAADRAFEFQQTLAEQNRLHLERVATATEHDAAARRLNELYLKAVEHLGSDQPVVRLGALFALERVGNDDPAQRQTVIDVVCAYLRTPFTPTAPNTPHRLGLHRPLLTRRRLTDRPAPPRRLDDRRQEREVRITAQRMLARVLRGADDHVDEDRCWTGMNLDLIGATLIDLDFTNCRMHIAWFEKATFLGETWFNGTTSKPSFAGAVFTQMAYFDQTRFPDGANFDGVTFTEVTFQGAQFERFAVFSGATFLDDADFSETTLPDRAWFDKAQFQGDANFTNTHFEQPPRAAGVRYERQATGMCPT